MTKDTKLSELVINKLTKTQYDGIATKDPNQLYIVTDEPGFEESRTNCITQIPQDIKLELNNGTLTLKAGSKVYVPNGAGKFDVITTTSNTTRTSFSSTTSYKYLLVLQGNTNLRYFNLNQISSGATAPTGANYLLWYDTTNNLVKTSADGGSTWVSGLSLPLCLFSADTTTITSIDQVFNGFGYIGSTVFALPNVKGLIPNGRNEDGTLKNMSMQSNKVITTQLSTFSGDRILLSNSAGGLGILYDLTSTLGGYDYKTNLIYRGSGVTVTGQVDVGKVVMTNGVITSFEIKQPFHAVDYNDKSTIVGWGMPDNEAAVTVPKTSSTPFTCPKNGYLYLAAYGNTALAYIIYKSSLVTYRENCYCCTVPASGDAVNATIFAVREGEVLTYNKASGYVTTAVYIPCIGG